MTVRLVRQPTRSRSECWQTIARLTRQLSSLVQHLARLDGDVRGRTGQSRLYTAAQMDDEIDVLAELIARECDALTVDLLDRDLLAKKTSRSKRTA